MGITTKTLRIRSKNEINDKEGSGFDCFVTITVKVARLLLLSKSGYCY